MKKLLFITLILGVIVGGIIYTNPLFLLCTNWTITNSSEIEKDEIFFKSIDDQEILSDSINLDSLDDTEFLTP